MKIARSLPAGLVVAFLVLSVCTVIPGNVAATNDPTPPDYTVVGNWFVDFDSTYENITINVTGIIHVFNNLTLKNVTLNLRPAANGTSGIMVFDGGGLYIMDNDDDNTTLGDASVITSDTGFKYWFRVASGGDIVVKNSVIDHCGFYPGSYDPNNAGLIIGTPNAQIVNNIFNDTVAGVQMWAGSNDGFIAGNTIIGSNTVFGMIFADSNDTLAENNTITDVNIGMYALVLDGLDLLNNTVINSWGGLMGDEVVNMMVMDNVVTGSVVGAALFNDTQDSNFFTNTFSESIGDDGFVLTNSSGIYMEGNAFNDNGLRGILVQATQDLELIANTIDGNTEIGMAIEQGSTLINLEGTDISNNGDYGIVVDGSTDVLLENCTIAGHAIADIMVNGSGIATAVNTSFGNGNTDVETGGELTVMWYAHVRAIDSLGGPVTTSLVTIKDALGTVIRTAPVNSYGDLNWTALVDFVQYETSVDRTMNPHTFSVNDGIKTINQTSDIIMNRWLTFEFNYAPISTLPSAIDFDEDTTYQLDLSTGFTDLDPMTYMPFSSGHIDVAVNQGAGTATLTPDPNWYGEENIRIRATDSKGLQTNADIAVTIIPVGDTPTILEFIPDQVVDEDAAAWDVNLSDYESDVDLPDDTMTWSIEGHNTSLFTYEITDGIMNIVPVADAFGENEVTVWLEDSYGLRDNQTMTVTIRPINDPPAITSSPVTTAEVGTAYSYEVEATDIDDTELEYTLVGPPQGMTINSTSGVISWTPDDGQEGRQNLMVKVSDRKVSVTQEFNITVDPRPNDPPVITSQPVDTARAGERYTYDVKATDAQSDNLIFSLTEAPDGMTINSTTGRIEWTPAEGQAGTHRIAIKVADPWVYITQEFDLTVEESILPDIVISRPLHGDTVKGKVDVAGTVTKGTYDVDKVEIQIDDGAWELVDGELIWSYNLNTNKLKNGEHTITARAYDSEGRIDVSTITVTVKNTKETDGGLSDIGAMGFLLIIFLLIFVIVVLLLVITLRKRPMHPGPGMGAGPEHGHAPPPGEGEPTTETPEDGPISTPAHEPTTEPPSKPEQAPGPAPDTGATPPEPAPSGPSGADVQAPSPTSPPQTEPPKPPE